jgi:hypothetical protein
VDGSTIDAGVRTVVALADHFQRLKAGAIHLNVSIDPVGRGFFTATEDERVESLLIGYWQARSALLDLIHEYRDYAERPSPDHHIAFLLAYSSALLLIDAARFLREIVHTRPVVRRKLNQPLPLFGIPGGFYDTIQRSLLSARHAWHLYHAIQYYRLHSLQLRNDAVQFGMQPIVDIIDSHLAGIDVTASQFAHARFRTRSDQWVRGIGRRLVVKSVYGLQKIVASAMAEKYVRPGHQPRVPADTVTQLADMIAPGDIFVVRKEYALTNYFLPGYWPHAALYLGRLTYLDTLGLAQQPHVRDRWPRLQRAAETSEHVVLESMKDGVHFRSWDSPLRSDSIVVLRPCLDPAMIVNALSRAMHHEGKGYDFDFDFGRSDRLVCTEVIYRAYEGLGDMQFPLTRRAGRPTLSGSDLIVLALQAKLLRPVVLFAPRFHPSLQIGSDAVTLLQMIHTKHC